MKLYYYPLQNFGDRPLNTRLWPQLLPTQLCEDSPALLVGIGALLNSSLPCTLLSSDPTTERLTARLQEKLDRLKLDFAQGRLSSTEA